MVACMRWKRDDGEIRYVKLSEGLAVSFQNAVYGFVLKDLEPFL